jgi:3-hydroxyacyl-CoA dehydrogenase/enoyl-CoA hydratase/3-hydroxybutyryl-CoA epimerase
VGLFPAGGGTWNLRRTLGLKNCLEIIMGGKILPPELYVKYGLVTVVLAEDLDAQAEKFIAENQGKKNRNFDPEYSEPEMLDKEKQSRLIEDFRSRYCMSPEKPYFRAAIEAIRSGLTIDLKEALKVEKSLFADLLFHENTRNKIDLFFLVTSLGPKFVRIDQKNVRQVKKIAVLGAGLMGQGIAQITADAGLEVHLIDIKEEFVESGIMKISEKLDELVKKGRWSLTRKESLMSRIKGGTDYAALGSMPLVIEAVFEDLQLKQRILKQVQDINPSIIFATNTSALPVEDIAEKSSNPSNVVGMHYFSPVPLMPLLEVVRGKQSSSESVATAVALGRMQKKTCVVVGSGPGFYTSRLFGAFVIAGFALAELGADPFHVDRIAMEAGFPRGPFYMFSSVGSMVVYHAGKFMAKRIPERHFMPESVSKVIDAGFTGAGKRGFYKDERGIEPEKEILQHILVQKDIKLSDEDIRDALILSMVAEAFACLSEGIVNDFVTMDLAAALGVGFPDCWHGPSRYTNCMGVSNVIGRLTDLHQRLNIPFLKPAPELLRLKTWGVEKGLI